MIAGKFGKVIHPFKDIIYAPDSSIGKVGVLTKYNSWINEEICIIHGERKFNIGVMEYTDEWSPFCLGPVPFSIWDKKPMQIDTDDDDDELNDDDGVNDSEEDSEPEDGEILPDKDNVSPFSKPVEQHTIPRSKENENTTTEPRVEIPANMNTVPSMESPVTNTPIPTMGEANGQSINSMGKETIIMDESTSVLPDDSKNSLELTTGINGDINGKNSNNASSGPPSLSLPTACFGPFPSRLSTPPPPPPPPPTDTDPSLSIPTVDQTQVVDADSKFCAKLKATKNAIKTWNKNRSIEENQQINSVKKRIEVLEKQAEERLLSEEELTERNEGVGKVIEFERRAVLDLKQKAKIRWTIDRDENSKFFHGYVNGKARKHRISG
ncbi:hypothetical protein L2E82_05620 [Cichorium intybus]|uniref:Uncharacterized protein n=1 Tax=Cichorium intybus TaxID=13427 RepID=A0ACB9H9Z2_CICIN|nr:hypothetical protein L2E82_05620 [Cichorium intybus]